MAPDPSAVHAMEKYGNYTVVTGKNGQFGIVEHTDGNYYEAWFLYLKDMSEEDECLQEG